ncbi:MAG TPA: DUF488 domain-containing protein [Smithella sp.]|nr:DUF488 domain-containing protein [Smithella sp.]HQG65760.1 DUF488 domain-containing protein [Smithella sp.]HQI71513.1 DUF488 domain-containing protein [Smithella sp.]
MTITTRQIFTIGHSTHRFETFIELLQKHSITAVADVRSHPYSSRLPQFNREPLIKGLHLFGIQYVFLGEELGARRVEPECYDGTRVIYQRIATLPKFQEGLQRLRRGAEEFRIAMMCAEKEPLDCHRTILICRALRKEFKILHILFDGSIEEHSQTEQRLVQKMKVERTLFDADISDDQLIQKAYDKKAEQIAYHNDDEGVI